MSNFGFVIVKHIRILVYFTFIFFMINKINAKEREPAIYLQYVSEVTHSFIKEIEKEFGLRCIGSGGGMPHDVEEISVKFISYKRASIEQAREIEVKATEKLLKIINEHEKIRPYLREYPFKANRAEVSILFNKLDNTSYTDGSVAYVFQVRNQIVYCAEDPNTNNFIKLLKEPYDEAKNHVSKMLTHPILKW